MRTCMTRVRPLVVGLLGVGLVCGSAWATDNIDPANSGEQYVWVRMWVG